MSPFVIYFLLGAFMLCYVMWVSFEAVGYRTPNGTPMIWETSCLGDSFVCSVSPAHHPMRSDLRVTSHIDPGTLPADRLAQEGIPALGDMGALLRKALSEVLSSSEQTE
jgi:hypothetical protein